MIHFHEKFDPPPPGRQIGAAEAAALIDADPARLQRLSGGFSSHNFLVRGDPPRVLRIGRDAHTLAVEVAVLRHVAGRVPVPEVLDTGRHEEHGWALLAWVEGEPLDRRLERPVDDAGGLGAAVGEALAAIHDIRFPGNGFFDAELNLTMPLEPVGRAFEAHVRRILSRPGPRARLGDDLAAQVEALLDRHGDLLDALPVTGRLVHSDFNTKNLRVRHHEGRWQITVLDWEFAHAGAPLTDVANLTRFPEEAPEGLLPAFVEAYRAAGGRLEGPWRMQARLLDLASMASFLDRAEEAPRTLATACAQIRRTLACSFPNDW